jgi:hypothetical protein
MTDAELDLGLNRTGAGPVETALAGAIAAAQAAGELTDLHAGAASLGLSLARGVDQADERRQHTARAGLSKELRLVLASLGLDRASRGELDHRLPGGDPFDELSRAMSAATGDPTPP